MISSQINNVETIELIDDIKDQILYLEISPYKAFVQYERKDNFIGLIHAEVPLKLRGQGYGTLLAKKTFEYVAKNNLKMEVHCEFLKSYLEKHGQHYKKYLV